MNSCLPNSSFTDLQGRYYKNVDDSAKKIKSKQLKNKLLDLWREVAGNDSPREWSKVNRTPILAMVPKSEQSNAEKVFKTVMANAPDEKDVQFAIECLKNPPSYFAALNDKRKIEEALRREIIGDLKILLDDNDEVRNELERKFHGDAYQWYPSVNVNKIVKEFAKNKYYSGGACDKVTARVMRMSDEDAKKLLIELLDKNYEVGLKILAEA